MISGFERIGNILGKGEMVVTNNVFRSLLFQGHLNLRLFGKELNTVVGNKTIFPLCCRMYRYCMTEYMNSFFFIL